jgi:uncharacterized membrane protein (UPF0127 family)
MIDRRLTKLLNCLFLLFLWQFLAYSSAFGEHTQPLIIVTQESLCHFECEVPKNDAERAKGLMFRQILDDDKAMLFVFPKDRRASMWMKNTYISLDMLFIDRHGSIIFIAENTTPLSEKSIAPPPNLLENARAVLEIKAGVAKRRGIQVNDIIQHPSFPIHD